MPLGACGYFSTMNKWAPKAFGLSLSLMEVLIQGCRQGREGGGLQTYVHVTAKRHPKCIIIEKQERKKNTFQVTHTLDSRG